MKKRILLAAAAALLASGIGIVVAQSPASAHGAMMIPGSRTWFCYQDAKSASGALQPTNAACASALANGGPTPFYNWFAVLRSDANGRNQGWIPDGQLCSGGTGGPYNFTAFNEARTDWPYTRLTAGATITFDYNNWAKHPGTFYLYVTKDGYNPANPLKWSDLDMTPFASIKDPTSIGGPGTDAGKYTWTAKLPSNKSGKHVIYSQWVRSDSQENFFNCSDVSFDGGNGQVVGIRGGSQPPSTPPVTPSSQVPTSPTSATPSSPVVVTPSSTAPTSQGPATGNGCSATYATTGSWTNGFQGAVTVKAGSAAISKWTVSWTFPGGQTTSQVWGGKASISGSQVSVSNETWNGGLSAGASASIGFLGAGNAPTSLNLSCSA